MPQAQILRGPSQRAAIASLCYYLNEALSSWNCFKENNLVNKKPYDGFVERLSKKALLRLGEIESVHSFGLGEEFEVALCHLLTECLPERFGVCRGFVVNREGDKAGDDLIVFDKLSFPVLRRMEDNRFATKQYVPIEAVYCYIECKHSLTSASVFTKALDQTAKVKKLLFQRIGKSNPDYEVEEPVHNGKVLGWPRSFPKLKNQPFCAIFSRNASNFFPDEMPKDHTSPDLIVMGEDHIATQTVKRDVDGMKTALFFDDLNGTPLVKEHVPGNAFGIGIITLFYALGWLELKEIDWATVLNSSYVKS